jgi:hypothetical protein
MDCPAGKVPFRARHLYNLAGVEEGDEEQDPCPLWEEPLSVRSSFTYPDVASGHRSHPSLPRCH